MSVNYGGSAIVKFVILFKRVFPSIIIHVLMCFTRGMCIGKVFESVGCGHALQHNVLCCVSRIKHPGLNFSTFQSAMRCDFVFCFLVAPKRYNLHFLSLFSCLCKLECYRSVRSLAPLILYIRIFTTKNPHTAGPCQQ